MKKYLLTGVMVLLPIALTFMLISYLVDLFTAPFAAVSHYVLIRVLGIPPHALIINLLSQLIALVVLFFLVLFLGILGRKVFFTLFLRLTDRLVSKIPFVSSLYRLFQDITKAVFSQKEKNFKKTVLVPFPFPETHALGFVTGDVPSGIKKVLAHAELTVFVPTSPYPLSGFLLLSPKKTALDIDVSVEEGFKFLLSCGAFHPEGKRNDEKPLQV